MNKLYKTLTAVKFNGVAYPAGAVLTATIDLVKAWPLKFEALPMAEIPQQDAAAALVGMAQAQEEAPTTEGTPAPAPAPVQPGIPAATPVQPATPVPTRRGGRKSSPRTSALRAVPKGAGKYDVVSGATGRAVNTAPLTKDEAERLIEGKAPEA